MIRKTIAMLLAAMMIFAFTACGQSEGESSETADSTTQEQTKETNDTESANENNPLGMLHVCLLMGNGI